MFKFFSRWSIDVHVRLLLREAGKLFYIQLFYYVKARVQNSQVVELKITNLGAG